MRYMLITFFRKPNGQIDERVSVSKRIKPSDIQTCNVILDYAERKIEKCVIEGKAIPKDWNRMHDYYKKIYPSLIDQLEKNNAVSK